MIEIQLTRGITAIVDDLDADLAELKWHAHPQGNNTLHIWYAARSGLTPNRSLIYLHRVILSRILERPLSRHDEVDHINHDGLDNRRKNLRLVQHRENSFNQRIRNEPKTSKYQGVHWDVGTSMWRARIRTNGKNVHLGLFDNEEDAARAYNIAAKQRSAIHCLNSL